MAKESKIDGLLVGIALGIFAYYALPVMPVIGGIDSIGQSIVNGLISIGQSIASGLKQTAGSWIYDNAGVLFTAIIGAITGYIIDST